MIIAQLEALAGGYPERLLARESLTHEARLTRPFRFKFLLGAIDVLRIMRKVSVLAQPALYV